MKGKEVTRGRIGVRGGSLIRVSAGDTSEGTMRVVCRHGLSSSKVAAEGGGPSSRGIPGAYRGAVEASKVDQSDVEGYVGGVSHVCRGWTKGGVGDDGRAAGRLISTEEVGKGGGLS